MSRVCGWVVLTVVMFLSPQLMAETAPAAFARGKELLKQNDFPGALAAFAAASRSERGNQAYLQQYVILRRVIDLREQLKTERNAERWNHAAQSLRAFYLSETMIEQAIDVSRQIHAREQSADSAVMLAHTLLESKGHEEAAQILSSAGPAAPVSRALLGVALARCGQSSEARKIATDLQPSQEAGPAELYAIARLQSVAGESADACATLRRCLESVPPSRQDSVKQEISACSDFASLAGGEAFAEALRTDSKVTESACSGGASCAGCPMRGNCASSQGR